MKHKCEFKHVLNLILNLKHQSDWFSQICKLWILNPFARKSDFKPIFRTKMWIFDKKAALKSEKMTVKAKGVRYTKFRMKICWTTLSTEYLKLFKEFSWPYIICQWIWWRAFLTFKKSYQVRCLDQFAFSSDFLSEMGFQNAFRALSADWISRGLRNAIWKPNWIFSSFGNVHWL